MALEWATFTLQEWSNFTLEQWDTFLLDPGAEGPAFFLEAQQFHIPGSAKQTVYAPGYTIESGGIFVAGSINQAVFVPGPAAAMIHVPGKDT